MALSKSQKKYLKKNLKSQAIKKIAAKLDVSEKEILNFLKSHWRKEKYVKFLAKYRHLRGGGTKFHLAGVEVVASPPPRWPNGLLGGAWLKQNWKIFLFLAFLVIFVYFNSLGNDFLSDDIAAIKDNLNIGNFSFFLSPKPPFFSPTNFFQFIIHLLFGLNPIFYRLANVIFHLGTTLVVYLIIGLFFDPPINFFVASIFAVHPLLSEAIVWISGGPYSLYSFLSLTAFFFYLIARNKHRSLQFYITSIITFSLALFTMEKAIVLPLFLFLYELLLGQLKKHWRKLIPFFFISGFWVLLFLISGKVTGRVTDLQTQFYQKSTITNPLIQIPVAISSYLELIFWPKNLAFYHSETVFSQSAYLQRLGVLILFLATTLYFIKKDRRIFFWLSFFVISLLPTLTPFGISWIVAERYVYLGSLGIFVFVAWLIIKIGQLAKNQKFSWVILAVILISLSSRTIVRNNDWKNQDTLWLATAKTSPSSPQNHNNLGDLYARHGDYKKAIEEFKTAIELKANYADAYHNLANVYHQTNDDQSALEYYQKALQFNPNLWQSHQNLAAIYFNQGKIQQAKEELEKAIAVNPQNADLYINLSLVYQKLGEKNKANQALQQTLTLDPQNQKAKQLLLEL